MLGTHPLALLANELRLIAQREFSVFFPVLCRWCPESGMIAAMRLHQIYGERLVDFSNFLMIIILTLRSWFIFTNFLYLFLAVVFNTVETVSQGSVISFWRCQNGASSCSFVGWWPDSAIYFCSWRKQAASPSQPRSGPLSGLIIFSFKMGEMLVSWYWVYNCIYTQYTIRTL